MFTSSSIACFDVYRVNKTESVAGGSDHELDHMKLASLPPGRIDIEGVATQIACGLHHTGM
jgi:hypothetical protein